MITDTIKTQIRNDLEMLPENALQSVREFVLFQRERNKPHEEQLEKQKRARRTAGMAILMKYKGTIDREIDVKKELEEA